jgi:hypothetical protein
VPLVRTLLGKDAAGRPTAEFTVKAPAGWHRGDREELTVAFQAEGHGPWACTAEVRRGREGGAFLALAQDPPPVLYDFGASGSRTSFTVPWDGDRYRVTLAPVSGSAPALRAVTAAASVRARAAGTEARLVPRREALPGPAGQGWRLRLEAPERVVGLSVLLEPPAAPLMPEVGRQGESLYARGLIWNLPALESVATRVTLGPALTDSLDLALPEGARMKEVDVLVRRETLVFPAEAGRTYYLHGGGATRTAPGALEGLAGMAAEDPEPMALGPCEPDPQGIPVLESAGARSRAWLPWAAGAVALLLGLTAFRLFKGAGDP